MEQHPTPNAVSYTVLNEGKSSAPPWVFVHGALCDSTIWFPLCRALLERDFTRKMVLLDLPGHGFSQGEAFDDLDATAAFVEQFLEDHGLFPCVAVGHSMGGAIAQLLALQQPQKVESLVLLATGATLGVTPVIFEQLERDFSQALEMMQAFNFAKETPPEVIRPVMDSMARCGAQTGIRDLRGCDSFRTVERLNSLRLSTPPMVCVGSGDRMTPSKKNRRLAESLGCDFHEIEGCGHMLHVERPAALADILTKHSAF